MAARNPIPVAVRAQVWELLRPYADLSVVSLPIGKGITIRWFLHRIVGSDKNAPA